MLLRSHYARVFDNEELFVVRAPKTGAQLWENPEEREKCGKTDKKTFIANRLKAAQFALWVPVSAANWNVCKLRRITESETLPLFERQLVAA